jgi:hypothetical protein
MGQAMEAMKTMSESAKDNEQTSNILEKRRQERRAKGDTIALATDKLVAFLPASLDGYQAEEPETSSMEVPGMSTTTASRTFTSADKGNVKVTLTDFNGAEGSYGIQALMFSIKIRTENKDMMSGTFQTNNELINGHEEFNKNSKNVTVIYGLGGRFILNIEADNQSGTEWAKGVANRMDINNLANM